MYTDVQSQFSEEQRVCSSAATELSDHCYDCGVASPNMGKGEPIEILFTVNEAFAGTGTTLTVTLQSSTDDAASDAYANIAGISSGAIGKATLVAGYQFSLSLPPFATYERYLKVLYTGDNTFETTGKITAQVVVDKQTNRGGY